MPKHFLIIPFALTLMTQTISADIDITGSVLSDRNPDCANYSGEFHSKVSDLGRDMAFTGMVKITADDKTCSVLVNQIPNHDFGAGDVRWPNAVAVNNDTLIIPRKPIPAAHTTAVGLTPAAILLNGIKWEANPAACFAEGRATAGRERIGCGPRFINHPWRYNVGSTLNNFRLDTYKAHVQKNGMYHYHAAPRVLYSTDAQTYSDAECKARDPSPVIGFALDGFPLYGPCFKEANGTVRAARSSYQLREGERHAVEGYTTPYVAGVVQTTTYNGQFTGDYRYIENSGDLDACNGMTVDGQYGYFVTRDFPYAIKCFTGTPVMPSR